MLWLKGLACVLACWVIWQLIKVADEFLEFGDED